MIKRISALNNKNIIFKYNNVNINNNYNKLFYSKSSDLEIMIESDNIKLNNKNKNKTLDIIIKEFSNNVSQFENHLNKNKPTGSDLYQFISLSKATFNNNDPVANQFYNSFNRYLNNNINNNDNSTYNNDNETLEFKLEFYSKSLNQIDKLFSILFNNSDKLKYTSNQYFYIIDSIIITQNKLTDEIQVNKIKPVIYKLIESLLQLLKVNSISLNIGNFNKLLEVYSNFNDKEMVLNTLDEIYLSIIKPDMNTYMLVFPYLNSIQINTLMDKIKGNSSFKTGKNTYQLLNEQFEKLLQLEDNNINNNNK